MSALSVERVYDGPTVTHWRVTRGDVKGGERVTVRVGRDGVVACLRCYSVECDHVVAVRERIQAGTA